MAEACVAHWPTEMGKPGESLHTEAPSSTIYYRKQTCDPDKNTGRIISKEPTHSKLQQLNRARENLSRTSLFRGFSSQHFSFPWEKVV